MYQRGGKSQHKGSTRSSWADGHRSRADPDSKSSGWGGQLWDGSSWHDRSDGSWYQSKKGCNDEYDKWYHKSYDKAYGKSYHGSDPEKSEQDYTYYDDKSSGWDWEWWRSESSKHSKHQKYPQHGKWETRSEGATPEGFQFQPTLRPLPPPPPPPRHPDRSDQGEKVKEPKRKAEGKSVDVADSLGSTQVNNLPSFQVAGKELSGKDCLHLLREFVATSPLDSFGVASFCHEPEKSNLFEERKDNNGKVTITLCLPVSSCPSRFYHLLRA